jgi:hypothetical protein
VRVRGVLEDGVLVQAQQRVREREQQHEEQVPALVLVLGLVREPVRRHSLWLRWRGSKRSSSSIRQRSFSKLLRQRCANC